MIGSWRALLFLLTLSSSALATTGDPPDASDEPRAWLAHRDGSKAPASADAGMGGSSARGLLVVLVLAATAGGVWWLKRRGTPGAINASATLRVEVLGTTRVGPKAQAVVARVGKRVVLLGVTDHSVQKLAWLDRRELGPAAAAATQQVEPAPPDSPPLPGFGQVLRDAVGFGRRSRAAEPALELAEETRDVFEPRSAPSAPAPALRVETQVAGLVARLKELGG